MFLCVSGEKAEEGVMGAEHRHPESCVFDLCPRSVLFFFVLTVSETYIKQQKQREEKKGGAKTVAGLYQTLKKKKTKTFLVCA